MDNFFSDLEGLRLSMEIETRGREFYRNALEKATKQEHKDLFTLLMTEEVVHLETFTKIFNTIADRKEAHSADYLFDADTSRYLTVLAESHVFPKVAESKSVIAEFTSVQAILQRAMQAEKDSVLLYDEMSRHAKFADSKKVFEMLKAEEQTHVVKLRKMMLDHA